MKTDKKNQAGKKFAVRAMRRGDFGAVLRLWESTKGIGLSESDSIPAIRAFLKRNPGFSAVATAKSGQVIASLLCGHDGRRGFLYHLAVEPQYRRQGAGKALLEHSLTRLARAGILRCNALVFATNRAGKKFWLHNGWTERTNLRLMQKKLP